MEEDSLDYDEAVEAAVDKRKFLLNTIFRKQRILEIEGDEEEKEEEENTEEDHGI